MPTTKSATRAKTGAVRTRKSRGTREETREKLIQAAIELLQREGAAAVTTVRVTRAIGLTQSGFYLHFSSVEQCLQSAAQRCTQQLRQFVADQLRTTQQQADDPYGAHVRHFQAVLDVCVDDRVLGELFLKRRFDESPIGQAMRDFHDGLRQDLSDNLRQLAESFDARASDDPRIPILAESLLAMTMAAGEMLLAGRVNDSRQLADELTAYTFAMCENTWHRIAESHHRETSTDGDSHGDDVDT